MIEYSFIIVIAIIQIGIYIWMDKQSYQLSKIWVLLGFLFTQILIFPKIFLAAYQLNDAECGMPIMAFHFFFLILGGGLNLIAHTMYYFINRKKIKL